MPKYRLVLDTNIYRKNPRRDNLPFTALSSLCKADIVKLYVPYVVAREFQTQQSITAMKHVASLASAARSLRDMPGLGSDVAKELTRIDEMVVSRESEIAVSVEKCFSDWVQENKAEWVELTGMQAHAAMEAYFVGRAPLKSPKERKDIPDSLIFQAIKELAGSSLTVVCEDNNLGEACAAVPGVTVVKGLAEFIETAEIQSELRDLDVILNMDAILYALEKLDAKSSLITLGLSNLVGEKTMWKPFKSFSIPDDNNEARVESYSEPEDIELDWGEAAYFGDGEFGIPFCATLAVSGFYYLFKGDIYRAEGRRVSLSDHNDHFFEAEEEFVLRVDGMAKVRLDREAIDVEDIGGAVLEVDVDSIDTLKLIDDE